MKCLEKTESTSGNLLKLLDVAKPMKFSKSKKLILELITQKPRRLISTTESYFVGEFEADACKLIFFKENENLPKGRILDAKEAHKYIGKKYNASDLFCGPLDKKESEFLFDKIAKIVDCVLVPIKNIDCPGVLALGSKNENTYSEENDLYS